MMTYKSHKCILCIHEIIYGLPLFTISLGVYYDNLCRGVSQSD